MVKAPMRQLEIGVLAGFDQSEAAAQLLQAGAAKIGIDIKLNTEPWPVISGKFGDPDKTHDLVPLWRSAYFADPHNWTGYLYNSRNIGAGNSSFYKNAKFDELTDKALVLTKQEERQPLYEEASRILGRRCGGAVHLQYEVVRSVYQECAGRAVLPDRRCAGHPLDEHDVGPCAIRAPLGEVTRHLPAVVQHTQLRLLRRTTRFGTRTAGAEPAACRQVAGIWAARLPARNRRSRGARRPPAPRPAAIACKDGAAR